MFKMSGYDTPEQYLKWAWSNKLGPAPPLVQGLRSMLPQGNPFTMEGGYTPEFSAAINKALFPNVRPVLFGQGGPGTNEYQMTPQQNPQILAALQQMLAQQQQPQQQPTYSFSGGREYGNGYGIGYYPQYGPQLPRS